MKTIKLYFLLISLLFCVIGCDRSQPDVDLLTIEELEAKSEELSSYSVGNYTLQDSLFFTREDGSIDYTRCVFLFEDKEGIEYAIKALTKSKK